VSPKKEAEGEPETTPNQDSEFIAQLAKKDHEIAELKVLNSDSGLIFKSSS
jgi:hypothetical protein